MSLPRPIIHIGYHKTASTWFQRVYYRRVKNLRYIHRRLVKRAFLERGGFDFDVQSARDTLELSSPDEPVILCEEELSGYLHNGGLHGFLSLEMARRLHATFPDARIVVFIRSQPDMMAACYQQYIRGGGTYLPERYLHPSRYLRGAAADSYKIPRFAFEHFRYLPLIMHYETLFGRDSVHVIAYEEFRRDTDRFLERYAALMGLDVEPEGVSLRRRNASYSLPIVRLARVLNRFTYRTVNDKRYWLDIPNWYSRRRKILEGLNKKSWLGRPPSAEQLFGTREVLEIEDSFRESNRKLADHAGLGLADLGYPL